MTSRSGAWALLLTALAGCAARQPFGSAAPFLWGGDAEGSAPYVEADPKDPAIVRGMARLDSQPVVVIGHQKGRTTKEKISRNFGMPNPEGYRKALRAMQFAEKFRKPIITFIDTPGAYPGIGAEERGQAEAIAYNLREIPKLPVPIIVVVHGEGGSGGALAIAISHAFSFFHNYLGSGEFRHASLAVLMTQPYARVVVLHVTILAGGLLAQAAGAPAAAPVATRPASSRPS